MAFYPVERVVGLRCTNSGGTWNRIANAVFGSTDSKYLAFGGISMNDVGDVFVVGAYELGSGDDGGQVSTFILNSSLPWSK